MSITQASLTSGFDVTAASDAAPTASISPTANRLVLIAVLDQATTPAAASPPTLAGTSLTWTQILNINDTTIGFNLSLFRGLSASPGSGVVTITHGAVTSFSGWSIAEFDGVDTGGTNGANAIVQSASNKNVTATVATVTATLGAFGSANNGAFSAHCFFNAAPLRTASPDSGWTEIHEQGSLYNGNAYASALETQWRASNDTTALATWSGNGAVMALAVELKAAAFLAKLPAVLGQAVKRSSEW